MKRILICMLVLLLLPAALSETFWQAADIPYYHADESCDFGGFSVYSGFDLIEHRIITEEEKAALRPCPACASEFKPAFTGNFPEWKDSETAPWSLGHSEHEFPRDILNNWGNAANAIYEKCGEGPWPENYAGIFFNACGGYTLMMTEPTPERIQSWHKALKAEFWVMEATFSQNYLHEMQDALLPVMGAQPYTIHQLGTSVDGNCVIIGVEDDSPENRQAIADYVSQIGYDPRAIIIEYAERAVAYDF